MTPQKRKEINYFRYPVEEDYEEEVPECDLKTRLSLLKEHFLNASRQFESTIMANENYEFPMVTAIQCIPEFHGKPEQLRPFVMQVEHFARDVPDGVANQRPLINVVYTKLRGEARL